MSIEWNQVKYIDCMDEKEGLPSLTDKSIDLCLTDPPWNVKYKGGGPRQIKVKNKYKDDYKMKWNHSWLNECCWFRGWMDPISLS